MTANFQSPVSLVNAESGKGQEWGRKGVFRRQGEGEACRMQGAMPSGFTQHQSLTLPQKGSLCRLYFSPCRLYFPLVGFIPPSSACLPCTCSPCHGRSATSQAGLSLATAAGVQGQECRGQECRSKGARGKIKIKFSFCRKCRCSLCCCPVMRAIVNPFPAHSVR